MRSKQGMYPPDAISLPGPSPKPAWWWVWADWNRRGRCKPRPDVRKVIPLWAFRALRAFNRQHPPPPPAPCNPPPPPKVYRREKALAEGQKYVGLKERTGRNDILFSDWYGLHAPWCAMFVSWCYVKAGSQAFKPGLVGVDGLHPGSGTYAYVPFVVNDARANINGLSVTSQPRAGDIVCYDWNGGVADHTGLFVSWIDSETFKALEGNTGVGNDSNGGQVMYRTRHRQQVEAFVRVNK